MSYQNAELICDECEKPIASDAPNHIVVYSSPGPEPTAWMHFHDECFDRTTALKASRVKRLLDSPAVEVPTMPTVGIPEEHVDGPPEPPAADADATG